MTTISSYTTQSGVRYRVRYRKPDGSSPAGGTDTASFRMVGMVPFFVGISTVCGM